MPPSLTTVLLLDGDETANYLHKRLLRKLGSVGQVLTATTPTQALAMLDDPAQPRPGLILCNLYLPEMNGWEFIRRFKTRHPQHPAIIAILTTFVGVWYKQQEAGWPAELLLLKPLTEHSVQQVLRFLPAAEQGHPPTAASQ